MQPTNHTPHARPTEVDYLRDTLEASWHLFHPAGPVAYVPPPEGDDESGSGPGEGGTGDGGGTAGNHEGGTGEETGDDPEVARLKEENAAVKRRLKEAEKARKTAERDKGKTQERERVEAGQWEELATEREQTIAEKDEEIARLNSTIRNGAFERAVVAEATRQRYRNPSLVAGLEQVRKLRDAAVDDDGEVDAALVERELKKLASREDYLVVPEEKRQREVTGDARVVHRNGDEADGYKVDPRRKMREGRKPSPARSG